MGIVKISDLMHDNLRSASDALSRSINAQAEHWMRIGMLSELHPELCHGDICQLLMRAKQAGDQSLAFFTQELQPPAAAPKPARKALR
ncbi:ParD-like antitoxin of type II ParDE toxin-antitoxin system [Collimonas sp. PA-H2]|uniref:ParD-like family protein n=1 Tax=Collimonas sp. PA-H2 TaxID=1881062 RepID=UPI000BF938F3|nr:ParD-like family protein [Collimonas sp. PA-H2]PFH10017.1 ParD-like antitoxin of type II ParDE toxin-antitoxin system [Collimonas sp. PA-H2]